MSPAPVVITAVASPVSGASTGGAFTGLAGSLPSEGYSQATVDSGSAVSPPVSTAVSSPSPLQEASRTLHSSAAAVAASGRRRAGERGGMRPVVWVGWRRAGLRVGDTALIGVSVPLPAWPPESWSSGRGDRAPPPRRRPHHGTL